MLAYSAIFRAGDAYAATRGCGGGTPRVDPEDTTADPGNGDPHRGYPLEVCPGLPVVQGSTLDDREMYRPRPYLTAAAAGERLGDFRNIFPTRLHNDQKPDRWDTEPVTTRQKGDEMIHKDPPKPPMAQVHSVGCR